MGTETSNKDRKRQRPDVDVDGSTSIEDTGIIEAVQSKKKARVEERRSLFVRSLPANITNEGLADYFSQHFPVKHAVVVVDQKTKESRGYGFVTLADADDAVLAKNTLDKAEWDGKRIRIDIAEPRDRNTAASSGDVVRTKLSKEEAQKPPKLIVRNLPWSIKTSEQLSSLFRSYGKVKFADLPQTKGKLRGFGFVTLRGKKNAEKALEGINGKEIDGRTLAVDWAVDKNTWDEQQAAEADVEQADDDGIDQQPVGDEDVLMDNDGDDDDEDGGVSVDENDDDANADLENFMRNHMQNLEDEDDEEDEDVEGENHQADGNRTTDNSSTIFIRNLPFTTTDEQLKSFFSHFGQIRYARVVFDKVTEKPAGTGFVCFLKDTEAKTCLKEAPRPKLPSAGSKPSLLLDENADPTGKYTLEGRLLSVAQAVNKAEAANLADSSLAKRRQKDKRRLYLLSEGHIGSGTPLFSLLSPQEVQMRHASSAQRKKMVQGNPSLHVSLTRIALRNIPRNIGGKELKELARKAVVGFATEVREGRRQPLSKEENARDGKDAKEKDRERRLKKKGIVRQAKIIFESNQGSKVDEKSGAGKSRGYGFIEYTSHHWALMGLRYLNGHQLQDDNGKRQRLIAEFAIENANVVHRRLAAEGKSAQLARERSKPEPRPEGHEEDGSRRLHQQKYEKPLKGGKGPAQAKEKNGEERKGDKFDAIQHRLIARTRLMRKKKQQARGKK